MQCVCCLLESADKKLIAVFSAADRKLYKEGTNLNLDFIEKLQICRNCKNSLKSSVEFLRMCIRSNRQLKQTTSEHVQLRTSKRKTKKKLQKDQVQHDETSNTAAGLDTYSTSDDEVDTTVKQEVNGVTAISVIECLNDGKDSTIVKQATEENKTPGKFLCTECGMLFLTSQRLEVHSSTHTGIKKWECQECDKVFATKFTLKAHKRTHTGERPFKCDMCPLSFAQGSSLTCHKRIHTKEKPFVCKICSKQFSQNTTLKTHMAALHLGKTVECDEPGCNKKFTRRSYLLIHKRDHMGERKYACDRCPNQYKQKSHLDRHMEASHLGVRHKCDFPGCTSEFSKSWSLKMHKFVHSADSTTLPYKCKSCDLGFQRRDKLLKHISKTHSEKDSEIQKESKDVQETSAMDLHNDNCNYIVVSSVTPESFEIQNLDGSFSRIETITIPN